jgi:hypothetical protein
LNLLPTIIKMTESRRMSLADHVARMGGGYECIQGSGGKVRGKGTFEKTKTSWGLLKCDLEK